MEQIRLGGALAYKCVDSLPGVLDDCGPVPQSEPELMRFSEVSEFQMPIGATNFWVGV
jgi:hypothetical protein